MAARSIFCIFLIAAFTPMQRYLGILKTYKLSMQAMGGELSIMIRADQQLDLRSLGSLEKRLNHNVELLSGSLVLWSTSKGRTSQPRRVEIESRKSTT